MTEQKLYIKKGVYYLSEYEKSEFENLYLKVRKIENRVYEDKILKNLPEIQKPHPLLKEWKIRRKSVRNLETYLKNKEMPLNIMELGCGNGWLTHNIAMIKNCYVIGVDVNKFELEQAARVFNYRNNHKFFYADIFADYFELGDFDIIILASSIQYFRNINYLLERLLYLTKHHGEIHIIDSPFYASYEISKAKKRTKKYYEKIGCPEMADFYFHHSFEELERYNPVFLYNPKKENIFSKFFKNSDSPFPWIMINNNF
jgi:SAM-dependent methyltransferase